MKADAVAHGDHGFSFVPISGVFRSAGGEEDKKTECGGLHPMYFIRLAEYAVVMAKLDSITAIDWLACELVEQVPGKVSGRPVVRGTRVMPDAIVNSYDLGDSIDEIHEGFPTLSVAQIKRLIEFAHAQRQKP